MTDFVARVQAHAVHETLKQITDVVGSAEPKAAEVDQAEQHLVRLRHVLRAVAEKLSCADPLLVGGATLDGLNSQLTAVLSQANQFVANSNVGHLQNANAEADKVLVVLSQLVETASPAHVEEVAATVRSLNELTNKHVAKLKAAAEASGESAEELQADVTKMQETITSEKARLDQAISEHQRQFSEAQEKRQQGFHEAEKKRTDSAASLTSEHKNTFAEQVKVLTKEVADLKQALEDSTQEAIGEIESRRDKAKEIVGIIAGTGMAGGYQKDANEQRDAFKFWNNLTVAGFVGLIGFSVWLFISSASEGFEWLGIVPRFIAIVAFGLFAAYAGRMAMKHRESERQHRHKQLALESVNAFIEDLEPAVQKEVKKKMAEVFFTQPEATSVTGNDVAPTTIDALIKLLSRTVDKLK